MMKNKITSRINNQRQSKLEKASNENGNKEIKVILWIFVSIFVLLIAYLMIFEYRDASTIINSSYNKRLNILANHVYRGDIRANDGSIIAQTIIDENGYDTRIYPYGKLFAHAVGYSSNGGLGIESMYAYNLLTSNDFILSRIHNDLLGKKNMGNSINTSLDPVLSMAAYNAFGDKNGAVVVSNVKTGEILTILSKPDFDPNSIDAYWDYYNTGEGQGALLNRATLGLYPPGSTFKIVTALEYIRENENQDDYDFACKGSFEKDGCVINCYHGQAHGNVDFKTSFAKSCNSSFANISYGLNTRKFRNTCEDLMFNEGLPGPYSYKQSTVNITSKTDDLLQTGIGQGQTLATPLHINYITQAIANGGVLMYPTVVSSIEDVNGNVISDNKPREYKRLLSEHESEKLIKLMESVVTDGTGRRLNSDMYRAAGKTGSAEYSSDKSKSHAWFTGFAPVDNPEIAVTVIVEGGGSGGETAVPVARFIFDTYFTYK